MTTAFIRTGGFVSILIAHCLAQENVRIPISRGPRGWHVDVSVDYEHDVSPFRTFTYTEFALDTHPSNRPRIISLFPSNGDSVYIFHEDLITLDRSRTARISRLSIRYDSRIFRRMGPISIIHNPVDPTAGQLILRSSIEEFTASCIDDSIVSLITAFPRLLARIYAGEDEDLLLGDPVSFDVGDSEILSIPNIFYRRYIEKMVVLGAVEPPSSDSGPNTNSRSVMMSNCSLELVSQLPPIRISFQQPPDNPYIELAGEDLIFVDQETRTCRLGLQASGTNWVILNPTLVPFMNFRIGGEGELHFCDSRFSPSLQDQNAHNSQGVEEFVPLLFSAQGGHIMVQVDNNGSSVVDMIVSDSFITRVSPEDIVPNNELLTSPALSIHGIPSEMIVFERVPSDGTRRVRSSLAIGYDSWILDQYESVAVIRNPHNSTMGSFILRSALGTFATSCVLFCVQLWELLLPLASLVLCTPNGMIHRARNNTFL